MKLNDLSKEQLIEMVKQLKQRKKFGLVWEDKPENVVEQCKKELPVLEEVKDKEVISDESLPVNLLIEGDNYHALSVLNYTHAGKIDIIYLDPPYNTGNKDFKYNDQFVEKEDSYRHSKWLSFIYRRLKLAKSLLSEKGVIFISIDSNENPQLKQVCNEIFGEVNFLTEIIVQSNPRGSQAKKHFADVHEYIEVYAKNSEKILISGFEMPENNLKEFSYIDNSGKKYRLLGLRQRGGEWRREQRPNMYYPFYVNPQNNTVSLSQSNEYYIEVLPKRPTGEEGRWTWSKEKSLKNISNIVGKKINRKNEPEAYDIFRKNYLESEDGIQLTSKPKTIWLEKEMNYQNGRTELKAILGDDKFDFPKPKYLIKHIIEMFKPNYSTILDFFAGSGTTGHAVLELNKEDGGNRKFILCTNNENGIAEEVCYPRVKKVIEGYADVEGIPANLKYFKTSFVKKSTVTDDTRELLVKKSVEMICVKEGTFKEVVNYADFKVYKDGKHSTGILFNLENITGLKEALQALKMPSNIYVFSLSNDTYNSDFEDLSVKHKLCPIPESILEVYRKLFKE